MTLFGFALMYLGLAGLASQLAPSVVWGLWQLGAWSITIIGRKLDCGELPLHKRKVAGSNPVWPACFVWLHYVN